MSSEGIHDFDSEETRAVPDQGTPLEIATTDDASFFDLSHAHERGSRLSVVITKDLNQGRRRFEFESEGGEREIVEVDENSQYEDDAVASNFIMGMPMFAATPKNGEDESLPAPQHSGESSPLRTSPTSLPPPSVEPDTPTRTLDVHSLLNLNDEDTDDADDDDFALHAPSLLSPSSASISKAFQKFNFSPSASPAPRRSVSASAATTPDPSRTPLPSVTETEAGDPSTPVQSAFDFPAQPPQVSASADFLQPPTSRPASVSVSVGSAPDVTRAVSLSVICPPSDKPRADLTSIGELQVHDAGEDAAVKQVARTAHVSYDASTGKYEGLPAEWASELNKAFGLPLQLSATLVVPGYSGRLPPVLVQMKQYLIEHGGLEQRGIFRLAPEGNEAALVKAQLNAGTFTGCSDVNVIANLLKVWFRDMPLRLLDTVRDASLVIECDTPERAGKVIMTQYKDPHYTLMLWLLDLCADVCAREEVNMMGPQNMAIVFAPNLFKLADGGVDAGMDPIKLMSVCKKYTLFLAKAIEWRIKNRA